jgi:hypothetical protein
MGLFPNGAHWPKILPHNLKRSLLNVCTVYVYCVLCTLFPPAAQKLCQIGRQLLSVVDNSKVGGK